MLRIKTLVHFLASTGIRPIRLVDPILKINHLIEMPQLNDTNKKWCLCCKVYDESKEKYWEFLTPETTEVLDNFFAWHKNRGEKITQESPIFIYIEDFMLKSYPLKPIVNGFTHYFASNEIGKYNPEKSVARRIFSAKYIVLSKSIKM